MASQAPATKSRYSTLPAEPVVEQDGSTGAMVLTQAAFDHFAPWRKRYREEQVALAWQRDQEKIIEALQEYGTSISTPGVVGFHRYELLRKRLADVREREGRRKRQAEFATADTRAELFRRFQVQRARRTVEDAMYDRDFDRMIVAVNAGGSANHVTRQGYTILTTLCRAKAYEHVVAVLKAGADPNAPSPRDGLTPLVVAARMGDAVLVNTLLLAGKDCGLDVDRLAVLDRDRHEDASALMILAAQGGKALPLVVRLLEAGAQVDLQNRKGRTALCFACRYAQLGASRLLLEERASPVHVDNGGFTPIDWLRAFAKARVEAANPSASFSSLARGERRRKGRNPRGSLEDRSGADALTRTDPERSHGVAARYASLLAREEREEERDARARNQRASLVLPTGTLPPLPLDDDHEGETEVPHASDSDDSSVLSTDVRLIDLMMTSNEKDILTALVQSKRALRTRLRAHTMGVEDDSSDDDLDAVVPDIATWDVSLRGNDDPDTKRVARPTSKRKPLGHAAKLAAYRERRASLQRRKDLVQARGEFQVYDEQDLLSATQERGRPGSASSGKSAHHAMVVAGARVPAADRILRRGALSDEEILAGAAAILNSQDKHAEKPVKTLAWEKRAKELNLEDSSGVALCGHCHENPARFKSLNTNTKLCQRCVIWLHSQPGFRHHRIRPLLPATETQGLIVRRAQAGETVGIAQTTQNHPSLLGSLRTARSIVSDLTERTDVVMRDDAARKAEEMRAALLGRAMTPMTADERLLKARMRREQEQKAAVAARGKDGEAESLLTKLRDARTTSKQEYEKDAHDLVNEQRQLKFMVKEDLVDPADPAYRELSLLVNSSEARRQAALRKAKEQELDTIRDLLNPLSKSRRQRYLRPGSRDWMQLMTGKHAPRSKDLPSAPRPGSALSTMAGRGQAAFAAAEAYAPLEPQSRVEVVPGSGAAWSSENPPPARPLSGSAASAAAEHSAADPSARDWRRKTAAVNAPKQVDSLRFGPSLSDIRQVSHEAAARLREMDHPVEEEPAAEEKQDNVPRPQSALSNLSARDPVGPSISRPISAIKTKRVPPPPPRRPGRSRPGTAGSSRSDDLLSALNVPPVPLPPAEDHRGETKPPQRDGDQPQQRHEEPQQQQPEKKKKKKKLSKKREEIVRKKRERAELAKRLRDAAAVQEAEAQFALADRGPGDDDSTVLERARAQVEAERRQRRRSLMTDAGLDEQDAQAADEGQMILAAKRGGGGNVSKAADVVLQGAETGMLSAVVVGADAHPMGSRSGLHASVHGGTEQLPGAPVSGPMEGNWGAAPADVQGSIRYRRAMTLLGGSTVEEEAAAARARELVSGTIPRDPMKARGEMVVEAKKHARVDAIFEQAGLDPYRVGANRNAKAEEEAREREKERRRVAREAAKARAQAHARERVKAMHRVPPELDMVKFLVEQQRFGEADKLARDVMEEQRRVLGATDRAIAVTLSVLSLSHREQMRHGEARKAIDEAKDLLAANGAHPGALDSILVGIEEGKLLRAQGEVRDEIALLKGLGDQAAKVQQVRGEARERVLARFRDMGAMTVGDEKALEMEAAAAAALEVDGVLQVMTDEEVANSMDVLAAGAERANEALARECMFDEDFVEQGRTHRVKKKARRASVNAQRDMKWRIRRGSVSVNRGEEAGAIEAAGRAAERQARMSVLKAKVGEDDEEDSEDEALHDGAGEEGRLYQVRLRPSRLELDAILEEPRWRDLLRKEMKKEGSDSEMDFLLAVAAYREQAIIPTAGPAVGAEAHSIFHRYLSNATLSTVPVRMKERIREELTEGARPDTFDEVQGIVRMSMVRGPLKRFWVTNRGVRYRTERALSLGLPMWSIEQIAKLAAPSKLKRIVKLQGWVKAMVARKKFALMIQAERQKAAELGGYIPKKTTAEKMEEKRQARVRLLRAKKQGLLSSGQSSPMVAPHSIPASPAASATPDIPTPPSETVPPLKLSPPVDSHAAENPLPPDQFAAWESEATKGFEQGSGADSQHPAGYYDAAGNWIDTSIGTGGYYDAAGNWVVAPDNGYAANGYYDAAGNWIDTSIDTGGYYDAAGNWVVAPDNGYAANGYYDAAGNWIDTSIDTGGYYDAAGNWISTDYTGYGGYFDEAGNWVSTAVPTPTEDAPAPEASAVPTPAEDAPAPEASAVPTPAEDVPAPEASGEASVGGWVGNGPAMQGGYYDAQGNWISAVDSAPPEQGYYDDTGNWVASTEVPGEDAIVSVDEYGNRYTSKGYYDPAGYFYPFQDETAVQMPADGTEWGGAGGPVQYSQEWGYYDSYGYWDAENAYHYFPSTEEEKLPQIN
jgi:hypothetical protein